MLDNEYKLKPLDKAQVLQNAAYVPCSQLCKLTGGTSSCGRQAYTSGCRVRVGLINEPGVGSLVT